MSLTDNDLLSFFRGRPEGYITERDIHGARDVRSLQPILFYLAYSIQAKVLVEIGVDNGSTTMPLLKAAEENQGLVYSVDVELLPEAQRLVKAAGYEHLWKFHRERSDDFFSHFSERIDFAVIDGDHAFPRVARDLKNCCQRLSRAGLIYMHDFQWGYFPDAPETFQDERDPKFQSQWGVQKALCLTMGGFPHLAAIVLKDRSCASVIIGRLYDNDHRADCNNRKQEKAVS